MAYTVTQESGQLINSFNYVDDIEGNKSLTITYLVRATGGTQGYGAVKAILDYYSNIQLGDPIGELITATDDTSILLSRNVTPASMSDNELYAITFTYGPKNEVKPDADESVVRFSAGVAETEVSVDYYGTMMYVGTLTTSDHPTKDSSGNITAVPKTPVTANTTYPTFQITATKLYTTSPVANLIACVGKRNNASITIAGTVYAAGTLLMRADATSPDNGTTWRVDFSFEYRSAINWKALTVAIDPNTNKPYRGIVNTVYGASSATLGETAGAVIGGGTSSGIPYGSVVWDTIGFADYSVFGTF